jgi:uncharacterized RDD family membrane protein YckC
MPENKFKQNIASPLLRLLSYLIDLAIVVLFGQLAVLQIASAQTIEQILDSILSILIFYIIMAVFVYPIYVSVFISSFGGTLGKIISGIQIQRTNGGKLTLFQAFFRTYVGYYVSGLFFFLGFIWIVIDKKRRAWHDMMSDTIVVVKDKTGYVVGMIALMVLFAANFIWMGKIRLSLPMFI